jgi:hypothetical protein
MIAEVSLKTEISEFDAKPHERESRTPRRQTTPQHEHLPVYRLATETIAAQISSTNVNCTAQSHTLAAMKSTGTRQKNR